MKMKTVCALQVMPLMKMATVYLVHQTLDLLLTPMDAVSATAPEDWSSIQQAKSVFVLQAKNLIRMDIAKIFLNVE